MSLLRPLTSSVYPVWIHGGKAATSLTELAIGGDLEMKVEQRKLALHDTGPRTVYYAVLKIDILQAWRITRTDYLQLKERAARGRYLRSALEG